MAALEPLRETTPRRIGPYELLARLGSGGMGDVHLARGPEGTVALKTVRAALAGEPGFRARFRREVAVARSVDSPHVARLTGGDADADPPWLATEYVPGPTLAEAVRLAGPLPAGTVLALGAHLVRALHAVHAAPALHRDLKPGNVLLAADGPRLIDFGVARAPDATTLTGTGLMVGTPGFMSPEHLRGGRHVVAASDVFCLASVLCYAATGEDPFGDGPLAAVLHRVSQAKADLTSVPAPLRDILTDCLRPDPEDRPGTQALTARFGAPREGDFGWPRPIRDRIASDRATADFTRTRGLAATRGPAAPGPAAVPGVSSRRDGDQPLPGYPAVPGLPDVRTAPPGSAAGVERRGGGLEAADLAGSAPAPGGPDRRTVQLGPAAGGAGHGGGAHGSAGSATSPRRDGDQPLPGYPAVPGLPDVRTAPPGSAAGVERRGGGLEAADLAGSAPAPGGPDRRTVQLGSAAGGAGHGAGAHGSAGSATSPRRDGDQPPAGYPAVPAAPYPYDLPTMGGAPHPRAVQASPRSRPRTAVKVALAGLAACAVGAAVVFGVYQGTRPDDGGGGADGKPEAAAAGKAPATGPDGIDESGGPDRAGTLPAPGDARPAGWHAWSGKLSKGPLGCAADATALVCRLVDGSYEAVAVKDGKQLWRYDPVERPEETGTTAMISPTGLVMIPGGGLPPAVGSGTVVVAAAGRIQARDAASGKVRWEKSPEGAGAFRGKPLVVDGRAFVGAEVSGQGYDLHAYDLSDGRELWHKRLASVQLARAFRQDFAPVAAKDGTVYARSERGVSAYDAATGAERGESEPVAGGCSEILVQGGSVLCGEHDGDRLTMHRLDARTLAPGADTPLKGVTSAQGLHVTAVNDKVFAGTDDKGPAVVVNDRTGGALTAFRPVPVSPGLPARVLVSAPLIVGDQLLYASNDALHQLPFGGKKVIRTPVEGAPGDRTEPAYDKKNGIDIAKSVRAPIALPAGGVVHIVYDQGAIRSVELPH
ncbi:PQQ-binding-like beta-propeller repeat protein [Streptomyces sp. VNUA116]|uniref:serine/threonine-protein kinase n=1 Tax=Streptomyces sp. VNUA116 TaxID=3062449 RepID=UPI0026767928|nr:protein kinase [Streptomyces sp. VNUA116]WKU46781.1 PQQ-binding-like beta-propeller repeat protein [Streptomyces sp. VNUA116]